MMTTTTCKLDGSVTFHEGYSYAVTIETSLQGLARLAVEITKGEQDEPETMAGMDMTPAECRALAKMLEGVAEVIEGNIGDDM